MSKKQHISDNDSRNIREGERKRDNKLEKWRGKNKMKNRGRRTFL